jgi:thiamine pyrophosphokinase
MGDFSACAYVTQAPQRDAANIERWILLARVFMAINMKISNRGTASDSNRVVKQYPDPVILLGGGDVNQAVLHQYVSQGWPVVAADGGANALGDTDIVPDRIIGDLDSLDLQDNWAGKSTLVHIDEQDTTDFEKCLYATEAPFYFGFGFLGQRLDHALATLHVLAKYAERKSVVLVDTMDAVFVAKGSIRLSLPVGSRFSIFPLGPLKFVSSVGLEFPLDGVQMDIGKRTGTSNRTTTDIVSVEPEAGNATAYAVIVPAEHHQSLAAETSARRPE